MKEARKETPTNIGEITMIIGLLIFVAIVILVVWLIATLVFFAAGRVVSGINTTFTDAMIVSLLGAICNGVLTFLFNYIFATATVQSILVATGLAPYSYVLSVCISSLITMCVYIPLIMKFFDTGFWGAVAVGLLVIIFQIVLLATLAIIVLPILLIIFGP